jgi:dienelactone hydrolase
MRLKIRREAFNMKYDEQMNQRKNKSTRRHFLKSSALVGGLALTQESFPNLVNSITMDGTNKKAASKSIIGGYGSWAQTISGDPPKLSFRKNKWDDFDAWREKAIEKTSELMASPEIGGSLQVRLDREYQYDGLSIQEISWQLPFGPRTEAIVLKPADHNGRLPGVLGLHDHGGNKYFGKRKITRTSDEMHPMMVQHQADYYGSNGWANELAKRGYVVMVHDVFTFASRRVMFEDMSEIPWGHCATEGMSDRDPEEQDNIEAYNRWAGEHEHIMAKSLFCAGTTWPGVFLAEDRQALDVLSARQDVDPERLGCAGLSGGGLRTAYLGGLDQRIRCAIAVGFMSTWRDFLLNKSYTHTWMTYTPLLPQYLDFPEILALRVPLPTMTLNNNQDGLFTLPEMRKADDILREVFAKAGATDRYHGGFYEGGHKFDVAMQEDAFAWLDKWLT